MMKKYSVYIFAGLGIFLAGAMILISLRRPPIPEVDFPPPTTPYTHSVAGSGIIEANTLNVSLGTAINGLVEEVFVQAGDVVGEGAPLFRIDTRELLATRDQKQATKEVTLAQLHRLVSQPRPEEVPVLEASVKQAQARLADEFSQYTIFQNVCDKRAISFNDFNQRKYAAQLAKYSLEQAKADLALLNAGAWIEDIKIASEEVEQAEAEVQVAETNLERATVRAPFSGQVMQVNISRGDFALGAAEDTFFRDALMVFGSVDPLHVRIDIDEDDAWRVYSGAPATAYVRGNSNICFPLEFVRIEPFVIPKRSLTGDNIERVDTRVLQLVYKFSKKTLPVYVGQLLDVFVEAKPSQGL